MKNDSEPDPAATARAALADGFPPLDRKPGYFTALVAVRHVHLLPLEDALGVMASMLGWEVMRVGDVIAMDEQAARQP